MHWQLPRFLVSVLCDFVHISYDEDEHEPRSIEYSVDLDMNMNVQNRYVGESADEIRYVKLTQ